MSDQNDGGPVQPGGWTQVPSSSDPIHPNSIPPYVAGSANYPPPPPPPAPGYGAAPGYPPPPAQAPYGQPQYQAPPAVAESLSPNIAALLSYLLFIPAIVFLVVDPFKRDPYIRFHAWQELIWTCACVVFSIVFIPVTLIMSLVHLGGLVFFVEMLLWIALGVCWLIALIKGASGSSWKIPVIGDIAVNLAAR